MSERASVYLTQKCETFSNLMDFFVSKTTKYCQTLDEKRAVFLSQIDFWDWEMDNLIFSFQTFEERSRVWESANNLLFQLGKLGILVRNSVIRDIGNKRYVRTHFRRPIKVDLPDGDWMVESAPPQSKTNEVVAPVDALNAVIKKWNNFIDVCEDILDPTCKNAEDFGAKLLKDLQKFKKKEM